MKNKLFVLSMDAMVEEDVEYLKTKPNFRSIMQHCCQIAKVQTIYPSITYPAHTSMITGCRTNKHGIFNNTHFMSKVGYPDWYINKSDIKVEDLFAAAKRAGCSTANVYWPIMGNNPNIDYNINEYFFYKDEFTPESILSKFENMGANEQAKEVVKDALTRFPYNYRNRVGKLALDQTFDDFINACTCSMIRRYQPDVFLTHNCWLDSLRHKYGVFNDYVTEGLDQMDLWLGEIAQAMKEAGVYENTNFVIISDHGQMNFARRLKVNVLFTRKGWITLDENNKVKDWKVYAQSNGMSASVWLKDPSMEQEVYDYLDSLLKEGVWGFSKIWKKEEVNEKYGFSGGFTYVLETDNYTTFSESCVEPIISNADFSDYRLGNATHGYEPEKGPQPVFVAHGPAFKEDVKIPFSYTIDEAPTFAHILGQEMPQAEGRVITEILA